jgi:hypothetical protein
MKQLTELIQKNSSLEDKIKTAKSVLDSIDRVSVKNKEIFARIKQNVRTRNIKH